MMRPAIRQAISKATSPHQSAMAAFYRALRHGSGDRAYWLWVYDWYAGLLLRSLEAKAIVDFYLWLTSFRAGIEGLVTRK
jgi:hypothetical protein